MQAKESLENINNREHRYSKELLGATCECGKEFFVNADDFGIEKLCFNCKLIS